MLYLCIQEVSYSRNPNINIPQHVLAYAVEPPYNGHSILDQQVTNNIVSFGRNQIHRFRQTNRKAVMPWNTELADITRQLGAKTGNKEYKS